MSRVTVTNPFDLLTDENEDPAPKKEQKPAAAAAKPAAKPAAVAAKPAAAKPAAPKADASKAPAKPAENKAAAKQSTGNSAPSTVKPAAPRDANTNLQEHNKETRAPRDKRDRPPQPAGDKKRTFDRKSGTGRPQNEVKRGGQGKGNWGGEADAKEGTEALKDKEEKTDDKEETEDNEKVTVIESKEVDEEAAKAAAAEAARKAAEEKEITYEEYLAKQKTKAAPKVDALKPRVVAAEDLNAAGLVALQRDGASEEKKDKKQPAATGAAGEKKDGKKKEDKKDDLASKLFSFASHNETRRSDRPFRGPREYDNNNKGGDRRGSAGGNKGPRGPRPNDNRGPAPQQGANSPSTQPPVQEKDFPALGGSDPVKA